MLISQRGPVNPRVQLHLNDPGVLTQRPSCSHGDPASHSSMSSVQSIPLNPLGHEHMYVPEVESNKQLFFKGDPDGFIRYSYEL